MRALAPHAGKCLFAALLVFASGALALGCNADVESVCHGGPCEGPGGGTGGATTSSAGGTGGAGGMMCTGDPQSGDIPCDVNAILVAKCQNCHEAEHLNGAPIDLFACERFHEIDCDDQKTRFQKTRDYVASDFMPIGDDLTADEKQTLLDWLDACAPCEATGTACGAPPGAKACYD